MGQLAELFSKTVSLLKRAVARSAVSWVMSARASRSAPTPPPTRS